MNKKIIVSLDDTRETEEKNLIIKENEIIEALDLCNNYTYKSNINLSHEQKLKLNEIYKQDDIDSIGETLDKAKIPGLKYKICEDYEIIEDLKSENMKYLIFADTEIEQVHFSDYDYCYYYPYWDGNNHRKYFINKMDEYPTISEEFVSLDDYNKGNWDSGSIGYHENIHKLTGDEHDYICVAYLDYEGSVDEVKEYFTDIQDIKSYLKTCNWISEKHINTYLDSIKKIG